MRSQLQSAFSSGDALRTHVEHEIEELRALGTIIVLEGAGAAYPLKLESLNRMNTTRKSPKRPKWLLLSVQAAAANIPERATVWVSDEYRKNFVHIFEEYLTKFSTRAAVGNWTTPDGNPAHQALVANIARIKRAVLADLWTSEGEPPMRGLHWWELWLDSSTPNQGVFDAFASTYSLRVIPRSVAFSDRRVVWVEASWDSLQVLPFTSVSVAEVRRPQFVDTLDDLPSNERDEYVLDLRERLVPTRDITAPAVCILDTGVFREHLLLRDSLDPADVHTVIGTSGDDVASHGTSMAGLSLLGDLSVLIVGVEQVELEHRLESVRIKPGLGEPALNPLDYGTATADAIALPEIQARRRRVFCLALSASPDSPGEPSLWSSTIDALAAGSEIIREGEELRLLSAPEFSASRLIVVAAGNVNSYQSDFRAESDTSAIEDPAQAWNALTVSAHTELGGLPSDPAYHGWTPLARVGELSPHSRTSMLFARRKWPIKPDICMEGGNVLTDGVDGFEDRHPMLSLLSTSVGSDLALTSANATSAATAQASRLAARAWARYPSYWPETLRGLLTHAAEWTAPMNAEIRGAPGKGNRLALLRRFGWGVPSEDAVLYSSQQAVTLVSQDEFMPFEGVNHKMRHFRLHALPWPREALEAVGDSDVRLRITLSYFVEPSPSRRGWRQRYSYASHGLRFDLQGQLESQAEFVRRVNRDAQRDEEGVSRPSSANDRWLLGPNQRHLGSLHQDEWTGTGVELAATGAIAVYPVGGWWKNNRRSDRTSLPVRYSLILSLRSESQGVDLYTPIANQIGVPTPVAIS